MSEEIQTALYQDALDRSYFLKLNAAVKSGIPYEPERIIIKDPPPAPPVVIDTPQPYSQPQEEKPKKEGGWNRTLRNAALVGLTSAGIGAGGIAAYRATAPDPVPVVEPARADTIQWMRERGLDRYPE